MIRIAQSDWLILIRILTAHLITEWLFQLSFWKSFKSNEKFFSRKNFLTGTIAGIISYIFAASWSSIWLIAIIFISWVLINTWKYKKKGEKETPILFSIGKQIIYLLVIIGCWLSLSEINITAVGEILCLFILNSKTWIIGLAYLTVIFPTGSFIGKLAIPWHQELWQSHLEEIKKNSETSGTQNADTPEHMSKNDQKSFLESLANAGIWVGRLERILILTFILISRYEAIGFLITAKIIRFTGMKGVWDKKEAEYVLIGTMWSFVIAIIVGILTTWLLNQVKP